MGSTMAGTQRVGSLQSGSSSMDNTKTNLQSKFARNYFGATHSSPFRDTVARGILTGIGMLGK